MTTPSPFHARAVGSTDVRPLDEAEVVRALAVFPDPTAGICFAAKPHWAYKAAPGNDPAAMLAVLRAIHANDSDYFGINPCRVDFLPSPGFKAADVIRRVWLFLDIDRAKTAADLHLSATDAEKEECRAVSDALYDHLAGLDWPVPVRTDSGNGFGQFYRIELPNDALSQALLKRVVAALADRFDTEHVKIDRGVHSAKQLAKLPGCWACKGPDTPERPHRPCRLLYVPETITTVRLDQLQAVAGVTSSPVPAAAPATVSPSGPFRARATGGSGDAAFARAALERECGRMACTAPGGLNTQLRNSGFALGTLVGSGLLDGAEVFRLLLAAAQSAGANNPKKDEETLHRAIEDGTKEPRRPPDGIGVGPSARTRKDSSAEVPRPVILTMPQLLAMQLPEPSFIIPGLLSDGLSILAGKPKLGKSWMALNFGLTIAAGGTALGEVKVQPGYVLYLALEDRLRRLQDRARKLFLGLDVSSSDRLHLSVAWPRQDKGGQEEIARWLDSVGRPALVIVDVWARFRGTVRAGANQYDADYQHAADLKAVVDEKGASALALHHCKKAAADDVLDEISGTLGLAGAADGALILGRVRGENEGKLFLTGRDIDERELALSFDPKTCVWKSLGDMKTRRRSQIEEKILAVFRANGGAALWPSEMSDVLADGNKEKAKAMASSVKTTMWRMAEAGTLRKIGSKYAWPNEAPPSANGDAAEHFDMESV